ncbi:MAG: 50S ribosomal protein L19 [Bacteriovoracaceae bacterium]|nr:50S ribosomal protein L19 [Bacteriovoracaceae bacterium]
MNLVDKVNQNHVNANPKEFPDFSSGDEVKVHVKIQEGAKFRIQLFEGVCIATKHRNKLSGHFRVRKVSSGGVGVERVFPYFSPSVAKVEIVNKGKTRRAKHYYLRERSGKDARLEVDFSKSE